MSDTSILMSYADLNMLIVRHEISSISQIKQSVFMSDQISHSFDGIIYNDYSRSILILDTMIYMGTIDIDIMQTNIYIVMAIQRLKMIKKYVFLFIFLIIISGCSLSPGMHMDTESTWFENDSSVFVESLNKELPIEKIENNIRKHQEITFIK